MNNECNPCEKLTKQFTCAIQAMYNLVLEQPLTATLTHPICSQLSYISLFVKKDNAMLFLKMRWKKLNLKEPVTSLIAILKLNIFDIRLREIMSLPPLNLSLPSHRVSLYHH